MATTRRAFLGALAAAPVVVASAPSGTAAPNAPAGAPGQLALPDRPAGRHRGRTRLTNLAHLRFLFDDLPLVELEAHTTYRIEAEPRARAPWTYADADGETFRRVGGGTFDEATGYYGQGAFNADDIARAAVVCCRHWRATGEQQSREDA